MRVRFLENYKVQAENGETYYKGKVYDMPPRSARHFTNKMVAVEVKDGKPAAPETASVEPAETAVRPRGRPRTVTAG